ncbi:hypothetical protein [Paenibacillus lentus]|uniref:Uncharacterized protein n=1 Tax=Paenibacillus lentus TaxID=1338368 RepID=A0A3Q8S4S4_9BACL|nr:hypothetical protein [Paenibacillus lentus]AZK46703.1 hypothetical protein EIM92_11515 [Paenibacillus lentus]
MEITILISIATAVSGILLGWLGRTRSIRQDAAKDAEAGATLQTDVEYIKRGVDDIRVDMRIQSQRVDGISERVTRVEESTKQAHKRIDRLEE